jgi:short-subunit dehydrogenase
MRCLSLDLTDAAAFDALCKESTAHNAEIALLINNAGLGTYGSLETLSAESQVRMTDLNVTALTRMTAMCLPFMKRGAEIRKGAYQMVIDPTLCAGCKQCSQVCKFGAIKRVR